MNKELEIVECTAADANKISEVAIKSYNEFYLYLWNDDGSWYVNRSFRPEIIKAEIENPNSRFYLLKFAGEAIGFMKLNLDQPLDALGYTKAMELERIYITKTFERKGLGRQAIEYCVNIASEMKTEIVWLKSMDSSPALEFYQRLGFEVCGSYTLDFEMMKPEFRGMKILMKKLQ
jgi:diamine N-acetyltransferase